jgi:hypothetical protein
VRIVGSGLELMGDITIYKYLVRIERAKYERIWKERKKVSDQVTLTFDDDTEVTVFDPHRLIERNRKYLPHYIKKV